MTSGVSERHSFQHTSRRSAAWPAPVGIVGFRARARDRDRLEGLGEWDRLEGLGQG